MHAQQLQRKIREGFVPIVKKIEESEYRLREYSTSAVYPDYFVLRLSFYDTTKPNAVAELNIIAHRDENWRYHYTFYSFGKFRTQSSESEDIVEEVIELAESDIMSCFKE